MLLTLVIILILIWSAVVGSLYSNFLVFYQNFSETESYHKARYASIAATERAELVIKQREPWYIWSWWRIRSHDQLGSDSDKMPDWTSFSYLSKNAQNESTVFRKINSQTDRIPTAGNWNIDKLLAADDSPDYNTMDYENAEIFLLYYDAWDYNEPYKKKDCNVEWNCAKTTLNWVNQWIKVALRLPPYIRTKFGDLDTTDPLIEDWWYRDDAIVDRQIRWKYNTPGEPNPSTFTIFATQDAFGYWTGPNDSAIRESHLNQLSWLTFSFSNRRNPITNQGTQPTIISPKETDISALDNAFQDVFDHSDNLQLRLSLLNLALWSGEIASRYPFLEYYIEFMSTDPVIASDRYFTIETEWNFWDYKVDNIMYKPTITESILRSFTTIF